MSTSIATISMGAGPQENRADRAAHWPQFNVRELDRRHFLLYRRRTGRVRPPAPVRAETEALCMALPGRTRPTVQAALRPHPSRPAGAPSVSEEVVAWQR